MNKKKLNRINYFLEEFKIEFLVARQHHKSLGTLHEGYAVILEEMDELWDEIKKRDFDIKAMQKEAIQVGAMIIAFLTELTDK